MNNKPVEMFVFPIANYTDLIQSEVGSILSSRHWLTFTFHQIESDVKRKFDWLSGELNQRQLETLSKIITTSIRRLIQLGLVKKVKSSTTIERTWQWTDGIDSTVVTNLTSSKSVATDPSKVGNRALNAVDLFKMNSTI
jgi:DNA-binding HxlR family transcriptional regulator